MHGLTVLLALASSCLMVLACNVTIPSTCFNSQADFNTYWRYNYPWGATHNGGAEMAKSQVSLSGGTLTLTATKIKSPGTITQGGKTITIKYRSGTVRAKPTFTVAKGGGYDFVGDFRATTTKGTWPAFWLTAVQGWPPEVDMAEWKGSGKISFNTFNTSSAVASKDVTYPSPDSFHNIKAELRDVNGADVAVSFYMDNTLVTKQVGKGFVGKAMYLIIDLQMEGSSGSPGPTSDTLYEVKGISVTSHNP